MSEHDWPEDYKHENGYYLRKCQCGAEFVGHKRRFTCKVCYLSHIEQQLAALRDKERENFNAEVETNKRHDILAGQGRRLYKQFKKNMDLESELAALREAGNKIISAIRTGLSQDEIEAMDEFELLQEQSD